MIFQRKRRENIATTQYNNRTNVISHFQKNSVHFQKDS